MVADVSSVVRVIKGFKEGQQAGGGGGGGKSAVLITRDLLGGCSAALHSKELDLDLQVPTGWEKRLDLKSGKVYLQRCVSPPNENRSKGEVSELQDLNFPPSAKQSLSLDLKLASSSSPSTYLSVCTLDKVKSALERAERETNTKKRSISISSSPPHSNSSLSSIKEGDTDHEDRSSPSSSSFAAACPSCLLYVLIAVENPKCPRCQRVVPSPTAMKKPRIDLNISI